MYTLVRNKTSRLELRQKSSELTNHLAKYKNFIILIKFMKQDYFNENNIKHIDFKDVDMLKKFLNPHARMISRKRTGVSAKNQRNLATAVKRARFMGLLPFVSR